MSKATRKDWLKCPPDELEKWLPLLLENMKFADINVKGASRKASATAKERVSLANGNVELNVELAITWTEQNDGVTFIVNVQEPKFDWTSCVCNRTGDMILGSMRTVCELKYGRDA